MANIAYHKMVVMRATHKQWETFEDINGEQFSSDTEMQRDHFTFTLPTEMLSSPSPTLWKGSSTGITIMAKTTLSGKCSDL